MLSALLICVLPLVQDAPATTYRQPAPEIVALLDAPPTPRLELSPDARWMLFVESPAMPSIADVTRPWIGLAGTRIDPKLSMPHQASFANGLILRALDAKDERRIQLPAGTKIGDVSWAPDSKCFVFTRVAEESMELWCVDTESAKPRRIAAHLNGVLGSPLRWGADGASVTVLLVPEERGEAPHASETPTGPSVQESQGRSTPLRTYQDLLRDADDERAFRFYAQAQLARVELRTGKTTLIGEPGPYSSADPSPDGHHLLVTRICGPYSYVLPWFSFAQTIELWRADGEIERLIANVPLADNIPMEGVRTGPRSVQWHASEPATLLWVEALDGGDPKRKVEHRDRWMALRTPFQGDADELFKLSQRAQGLRYLVDPNLLMASEYDRDRRWTRTLLLDLKREVPTARVLDDRSVNDRYGDPGSFVLTTGPLGTRVVRQDGSLAYRTGQGATSDGARPYLDRYDLASGKSERLWQCAESVYESVTALVRSSERELPAFITSFESPTEPPNYRLRDLVADKFSALTSFPDPQPLLRELRQELVKYKRADGVELSATAIVRKDKPAGERLPLLVWAYPLEFTDAGTAGQVNSSPFRFVRVRGASQILFALHGYAVWNDAAMPLVGDPETVNDTFIQQIVMNAEAALTEAEQRGIGDRTRAGVAGHSYGAFMTANLLAHCDLFRAGIARSGAYNRTLTPFGFQSERRTIWEASKPYLELSPFLVADKLKEPILFIHGEKDSNQGTFPMQSERMFQAVQGNGGHARLVMLPGESHGYQARESILHTVAEMFDWLDVHVKGAKGASAATVEAGGER